MREHANNIRNGRDGFLVQRCTACNCARLLEDKVTLYKHRDDYTRVIVEVAQMERDQVSCVSKPQCLCLLESVGVRN